MSVFKTNVVYESDENPKKLLLYANEQRQEGLYNDVTIKAGKQVMRANRMILSCYSKFFEKMFRSQMKEQYQDAIEIKDFDGEAIKLLIDFIYIRKISIDQDNVMKLLKASHFLQLEEVAAFCFGFLESGLMVDNCLDVLSVYTLYKPESSLDNVYRFIGKNIDKVVETDLFKSLSKNELVAMIPNLNNAEQASMYKAVRKWVEHDSEHRSKDFPSLFRLIDLDGLTLNYLENVVAADELVKRNYDCINAVVNLLFKKLKQPSMGEVCCKILCLGGGDCGRRVIEVFNVDCISAAVYPKLPVAMFKHCVLYFNNAVYCVGGWNSLTNVYRLNLNSPALEWKEMCSMNKKRRYHGAAVFQNSIVVSGGYDGGDLDLAEFYDTDSNEWKSTSSMKRGRSSHGLVECNGYLYAIGGSPTNKEPTVERLQSLNGEWEPAPSMLTSRDRVAAVNCGGRIYAIGGIDENNQILKTVEKFDPVVNKWSYVKEMIHARRDHAACVLRGKIYVVGGEDEYGDAVNAVECYDPVNDSWSIVDNVTYSACDHALVAL